MFQIITLDNWSNIMYNLADGYWSAGVPYIFCLLLIFFGNYFMLNFMLAVVFEAFLKTDAHCDKEEGDKLLKEKEQENEVEKEKEEKLLKKESNPMGKSMF